MANSKIISLDSIKLIQTHIKSEKECVLELFAAVTASNKRSDQTAQRSTARSSFTAHMNMFYLWNLFKVTEIHTCQHTHHTHIAVWASSEKWLYSSIENQRQNNIIKIIAAAAAAVVMTTTTTRRFLIAYAHCHCCRLLGWAGLPFLLLLLVLTSSCSVFLHWDSMRRTITWQHVYVCTLSECVFAHQTWKPIVYEQALLCSHSGRTRLCKHMLHRVKRKKSYVQCLDSYNWSNRV